MHVAIHETGCAVDCLRPEPQVLANISDPIHQRAADLAVSAVARDQRVVAHKHVQVFQRHLTGRRLVVHVHGARVLLMRLHGWFWSLAVSLLAGIFHRPKSNNRNPNMVQIEPFVPFLGFFYLITACPEVATSVSPVAPCAP